MLSPTVRIPDLVYDKLSTSRSRKFSVMTPTR